ncbi:MAG: hypothetical protein JW797_17160 [Bradymonadales bacterium]|nr:hypothetical protein [Bradymonadales bacterium]
MKREWDRKMGMIVKEPAGFRVVGTPLWIDARLSRRLCVISHAHADHVAPHEHTVATPTTLALLGLNGQRGATACQTEHPFSIGKVRLELLSAGHLPGSAQLLVEMEGVRILYTSDLYDQPQQFAEPLVTRSCDLLILDATYGTPQHRFPGRQEAADRLREEVSRVLGRGGTPLVLVEGSLGRAQEILKELSGQGHPLVASRSICRWNRRYRELGMPAAACMPYAGRPTRGSVLVFPMKSRGLEGLGKIQNLCKIACSGQEANSATCRRLGVDRIVPFVDHADFDGLLRLVESIRPHKTLTVFGYPETLAQALRERGQPAEPLAESDQMGFDF